MRSLRGLAAFALASAGIGGLMSDGAGQPRFVLGGGSRREARATAEDRRKRNLAAGGRDDRIKADKARRSFSFRRRTSGSRSPGFGRLFKSDKREAAFGAALADGKSRNEAAKIARRGAA